MIKLSLLLIGGVLFLVSSLFVSAHQESKLSISDGEIIGLPEKYGTCSILFEKNAISINGKVIDLPDFLGDVLKSKSNIDDNGDALFEVGVYWRLSISASWSHEKNKKDSLPEYMILKFFPENMDYHISVIINLEIPGIIGTKITLTTYSEEDGDKWINSRFKKPETLSSTQMELIVSESSDLNWSRVIEK